MDKIGKLYTYSEFIQEHHIEIPRIQRDYTYGSNTRKTNEVLNNLLSDIYNALFNDGSEIILDFVYGSTNNREMFDVVTARAVTNMNNLLEFSIPLVKVNKYFIAMKGSNSELDNIDNVLKVLSTKIVDKIEFKLPYEDSTRNLIKFEKLEKTNMKYPRKFSDIKKKAL